mgnify:CR=1 FL=1
MLVLEKKKDISILQSMGTTRFVIQKILFTLLLAGIAIQVFRPAQNKSSLVQNGDIVQHFNVPANVAGILRTSCYDCHSNNTHYPWYSFIQPGGWWMASHIKKGKAVLNFSEFGKYSNRKQQSKLQAIANSIKDETMPLQSYTFLHQNAVLSTNDKKVILDWLDKTKDSLSLVN